MISTVTSTTVSTITSVALAASLGLAAVLLLISFLVVKELASSGEHPKLLALSRLLNVAIYPLLAVFAVIVTVRVVDIL